MSKMIDHTISYVYCWNRHNEPNYMNNTENQITKMSNLGKLIFYSPFENGLYQSPRFTVIWIEIIKTTDFKIKNNRLIIQVNNSGSKCSFFDL